MTERYKANIMAATFGRDVDRGGVYHDEASEAEAAGIDMGDWGDHDELGRINLLTPPKAPQGYARSSTASASA